MQQVHLLAQCDSITATINTKSSEVRPHILTRK